MRPSPKRALTLKFQGIPTPQGASRLRKGRAGVGSNWELVPFQKRWKKDLPRFFAPMSSCRTAANSPAVKRIIASIQIAVARHQEHQAPTTIGCKVIKI